MGDNISLSLVNDAQGVQQGKKQLKPFFLLWLYQIIWSLAHRPICLDKVGITTKVAK